MIVPFAFIITFLPGLAFWGIEQMRPDWQTGRTEDYVALLLSPEASFFFVPLLAYAILVYWLLLLGEQRFAQKFWVRFGIYTGILLAVQYIVLATLITPLSILIGGGIVIFYWLTKRIAQKLGKGYAFGFIFILALLGLGIQSGFDLESLFDAFLWPVELLFFVLMGMGIGSPILCFGIAFPTGIGLWQEYEQGATAEAQIVRDADKLEMVMQAREYSPRANASLDEFWRGHAWNFVQSKRLFEYLCVGRQEPL